MILRRLFILNIILILMIISSGIASAASLLSVTVGSQVGTLTYGTGGSVTYLITVYKNGTGTYNNTDLKIDSGLPSGTTATFFPSKLNFGVDQASNTSTLTITYSGTAPAGMSNFIVNASRGRDNKTGNGILTVFPALLTITANNKTKIYGMPLPAFDATYSGFVLGENPSVLTGTLTFNTTATSTSPVGTYPITVSGQTSSNYLITYVPGILTVIPDIAIPEFPTVALPIAGVIGMIFLFQQRKTKDEDKV